MVHQFKLFIGFLCIGLIVSGCTTTGYSGGAKINNAAFAGWKKAGPANFNCLPPQCKPFSSAAYKPIRANQLTINLLNSPKTSLQSLRADMVKAFSRGGRGKVEIDGNITRTTVKGHRAIAFNIKTKGSAGIRGYMIIVPIGSTMHSFVGFGKTSGTASSTARKIANAWQP